MLIHPINTNQHVHPHRLANVTLQRQSFIFTRKILTTTHGTHMLRKLFHTSRVKLHHVYIFQHNPLVINLTPPKCILNYSSIIIWKPQLVLKWHRSATLNNKSTTIDIINSNTKVRSPVIPMKCRRGVNYIKSKVFYHLQNYSFPLCFDPKMHLKYQLKFILIQQINLTHTIYSHSLTH